MTTAMTAMSGIPPASDGVHAPASIGRAGLACAAFLGWRRADWMSGVKQSRRFKTHLKAYTVGARTRRTHPRPPICHLIQARLAPRLPRRPPIARPPSGQL
jgi:hypothetical protein